MLLPGESEISKSIRILIPLIFLFAVIGCASFTAPADLEETAPATTTAASLQDKALVFGRVRWNENGELRNIYRNAGSGWNIHPRVVNLETMQTYVMAVEADGRFYWILPRGLYMIYQLDIYDPRNGIRRLDAKVAFRASGEYDGFYLGVLEIAITGKRDFLGGLWIKSVNGSIKNEIDQDASAFRSRFSDSIPSIASSLMLIDERLPELPELRQKRKLADIMQSFYPLLNTLQY